MKQSILFVFLIFATIISKAQEHSLINFGAGWPVFFNNSTSSEGSGSNYSIGSNSLNVFIEKSGLFNISKSKDLYITPGVNYCLFHESGAGGGLGGGSSTKLKHQAVSLYAKFLIEIDFKSTKSPHLYVGFMPGVYLFSNTTGERFWWNSFNGPNRNGIQPIDRNGKHFFNSSYMGFLFGFKAMGNRSCFIQPHIEFSFFPNYAIFYNPHISTDEQNLSRSMAMITIAIGLNPKKKE